MTQSGVLRVSQLPTSTRLAGWLAFYRSWHNRRQLGASFIDKADVDAGVRVDNCGGSARPADLSSCPR